MLNDICMPLNDPK